MFTRIKSWLQQVVVQSLLKNYLGDWFKRNQGYAPVLALAYVIIHSVLATVLQIDPAMLEMFRAFFIEHIDISQSPLSQGEVSSMVVALVGLFAVIKATWTKLVKKEDVVKYEVVPKEPNKGETIGKINEAVSEQSNNAPLKPVMIRLEGKE